MDEQLYQVLLWVPLNLNLSNSLIVLYATEYLKSMPTKSVKQVKVTAKNVTVNPSSGKVSNLKSKPQRKRRQAQERVLGELDSGRMTDDTLSLTQIRNMKCVMDSNEEGWYFKYLDPAGSVEVGRAIGEFSKIPDGLCTFSVDAEIRTLTTLSVPGVDLAEGLPLDGKTWSLTLISYPMFRTGYIAVANNLDKEIGDIVRQSLVQSLNNLTNYRQVIDSKQWVPFATEYEEGWFYLISPLPPTYDLPDPLNGTERTLTSYRLTYKGITIEHNAPTLIDQGFWIGGHVAIDPSIVAQDTEMVVMVPSWINYTSVSDVNSSYTITIPNMPPADSLPPSVSQIPGVQHFSVAVLATPASWSYTMPFGYVWYSSLGILFAESGDIVTFTRTSTGVTMTSSNTGADPASILTLLPQSVNASNSVKMFMDLPGETEAGGTAQVVELPALTPEQVAANNPKMEQFLMKESMGSYIVHKKIRKPVFQLTPANTFGPIQFSTPGYSAALNHNDGSGILDTIDENMSTASVCVRGIAHANVLVIKLYQGWEGLTNVNTPFGQFGHTGLPRNDEVLELVDNLNTRTTGVYPANDNFLGLISKFASQALSSLFTSEATAPMLGNLAKNAVEFGVGRLRNRMNSRTAQRMARR